MKLTTKYSTLTSFLMIAFCTKYSEAQSITIDETNKPSKTEPNTPSDGVRNLESMVVTGSAIAEPLKDAPVRTELIERELIEATASPNLAQIIEYTPGVRVETNCANCNTQNIQMLGLPQSYIAILQDGMPTFSGLAGVLELSKFPPV